MGFLGLPPIPLGITSGAAPTVPVILDTFYGPGSPEADYVLIMMNSTGKIALGAIDQYVSLDYVLNENDIGVMSVELPFDPTAPWVWFKDNQLYLFRRVPFGTGYYLEGNTAWLINHISLNWPESRIKIDATNLNSLLGRWVIPYNDGNPYTYKLDEAGDMANAIVRENMGNLALDTTRDISSYLTVPVDVGIGATVRLQFSNNTVLDAIQKVADASYQYGTWLGFDIVVQDAAAPTFRFETYITTSASDRRLSSEHPLLFGIAFKTAEKVTYSEDYSEEVNVAYVAGQGDEFIRPLYTATNPTGLARSPFRNEGFFSASSDAPDATALATVAQQKLNEGRPRITMEITPNEYIRQLYGVEWKRGTLVTGEAFGKTQDFRIDQVHVTYSQKENIEVRMRSL